MRHLAAVLATALLSGCVHQQTLDVGTGVSDELARRKAAASTRACPVRLAGLEDARLNGDRAGVAVGLDASLADPLPLLERELARVGIRSDAADGTPLRVTLKRLYLQQTHETQTPTVVLAYAGPAGTERIVRGHDTTLVWNGTPAEYFESMAVALRLAVDRLAADVDATCPG